MNFLDKIDYRSLTLKELEELINDNMLIAKSIGVKISKKLIDGNYVGVISRENEILFNKTYKYKYEFIATAYMHFDFSTKLNQLQKSKIVSRRKGEGDGDWSKLKT